MLKVLWIHDHILVGFCTGRTPILSPGSRLRCWFPSGCRCSGSWCWCLSVVAGYHQRWSSWFLAPAPRRGAFPYGGQDPPLTHQLRRAQENSGKVLTHSWYGLVHIIQWSYERTCVNADKSVHADKEFLYCIFGIYNSLVCNLFSYWFLRQKSNIKPHRFTSLPSKLFSF